MRFLLNEGANLLEILFCNTFRAINFDGAAGLELV